MTADTIASSRTGANSKTGEAQRIVELEEQLAHQARTIEELSATVARQWDALDAARRKLDALAERFLALEETALPAPEITRPPHY